MKSKLPLPVFRITLLLLVILLSPAFTVQASLPKTIAYKHEQAVLLARKRHLPKAVAQLKKLHSQLPDNNAITNDLIVISSWAGRYREARVLFEKKKADTYPEYVRYAMVNVYRSLKKPETGLMICCKIILKT